MMMPGRVLPESDLAFSNPDASAIRGRAEIYAHNMSIFAEAMAHQLQEDPDIIPVAPRDSVAGDLLARQSSIVPKDYRPVMPWRVTRLMEGGQLSALVVFINSADLPPLLHNADLAHGLSMTAGRQTPAGIVRKGVLGMRGITSASILEKYPAVVDLPSEILQDGTVAVVVCIGKSHCPGG